MSRASDVGDQDATGFMCRKTSAAVPGLEALGVPFSRTQAGRVYQRTCARADQSRGNDRSWGNMESAQAHPTGSCGSGCLITEGSRGEAASIPPGERVH